MTHEDFKEMVYMFSMGELPSKHSEILQNHLLECEECSNELNSLMQLKAAMTKNKPVPFNESILEQARTELKSQIAKEENRTSGVSSFLDKLSALFFGDYKVAFSAVSTLMIGIFVGYLFFAPGKSSVVIPNNNETIDVEKIEQSGMQISNIRFKNPFAADGEVEVSFDAVKPISFKGDMNDAATQRLLAAALVSNDNPGLKLKTINTIASQPMEKFNVDPKVKEALITSLKVDENPGVRREALNVLMRFPIDPEIRDAFLFVLSNDQNSGLRVAAINALSNFKINDVSLDDEIINVLNEKAENDENEFIKLRAASLLKEVK